VRALGGTPVNMSPADAYSAMQKGVLEGITFPAFASADYKLYEVGKVMTRPLFGLSNVLFLINVRKLSSLSPELQKVVLAEGRKIEQIGKDALDKVTVDDETRMKQNGVKTVDFGPALAPKLNPMYNDGILASAGKSSPEEVKELWDMAKAKNLLNQYARHSGQTQENGPYPLLRMNEASRPRGNLHEARPISRRVFPD
jgi:TRAP-type C4-dicarboxylate transport system substrate-binding protein